MLVNRIAPNYFGNTALFLIENFDHVVCPVENTDPKYLPSFDKIVGSTPEIPKGSCCCCLVRICSL
jgi:hypothetical protein